jgi:ATP-binding cassette subfamily F protein 3
VATTPCGGFSGGEKSRLALALLIWRQPNLLLLDEPTNHLDLEMRHALTMALQDYEGGMVLVSHDRALLRSCCDRFILVEDGRAEPFDGDIDDYRDWLAGREAASGETARPTSDRPVARSGRAQDKAERQALLAARRPLVKEAERLEADMARWQQEKFELERRLADPALYQADDKSGLQEMFRRQSELERLILQAEERWLELQERLEAIPI